MDARLVPLAAGLAALSFAASGASADGSLSSAVYSIRPDGADRQLVARPDPPVDRFIRSPDERRILFTKTDGTYVADLSGASAARIGPNGSGVFSPDGSKIALSICTDASGYRCHSSKLYVVNVDGSGFRLLAENSWAWSWSPNGRRLVYGRRDSDPRCPRHRSCELRVIGADGSGDRLIARGESAVWAPRGTRIVYLGFTPGASIPCFVDADGSHRRCLRGIPAGVVFVWSPDGKRVAFRTETTGSSRRLAVVRGDGGGLRRFRRPSGVWRTLDPLAWSPDGRRIAFQLSSNYQIFIQPLGGGRPHQVTTERRQAIYDVRWRGTRIRYSLQDFSAR